jgi:GntR family transcriptional regulator, transcriptional repressor for pyruvate dehydrogenase complex
MLSKISRGTLAEQVTEKLLTYIEAQHLKPGELLPSEGSLSESFGVSRPVVREALKNLEGKGVVEIVNGKGALIRPIDSDPLRLFFQRAMMMESGTILELMEVRKGLEVQAAILAAQRRDAKDLQTIGEIVRAMRENMHDVNAYTRLDVELHLRIAAAAHNEVMFYLVESIRGALLHTVSAGIMSRGPGLNLESIQRAHETLFETISSGDAQAAMLAMNQHFDEAISSLAHPHS